MTLEAGLNAYLLADVRPELPDGTGFDYKQDAWLTTDSWAGTLATPSVSGGVLRVTADGGGIPSIARAISYTAKRTVKLRIRGSKAGSAIWRQTVGGTDYDAIFAVTTSWAVVSITEAKAGAVTLNTIALTSFTTAADWVEIDWIYIGDGLWSKDVFLASDLTGIHWLKVPDNAIAPFLTYYSVIDTDEVHAFGSVNTGQARIQFDVVADDKADKKYIYAVRDLLRNKQGVLGGVSMRITPAFMTDRYNPATKKYVFTTQYEVTFSYD